MTSLMTALFDDYTRHPIPADVLTAWATQYAALAASPTDLATTAAGWDHSSADAVLIPLHQLAVTGDRHAAQLIIVALAPRLAAVARRQPDSRAEITDELIGYLFEAAVAPHPQWTTRYSDQLVRAALRARLPRPGGYHTFVPLVAEVVQPGDPFDQVDSSSDIASFLDKQIRRGALRPTTAAALTRVALGRPEPPSLGSTEWETARKRRQRDMSRLRALGPEVRAELLAA